MNISYIRSGDYFIPNLKLPEENRPIGKWGRMHREYLKEHHPIRFNNLVLCGNLWTYLADLNEQAQQRMDTLIVQMQSAEGITEVLKAADPMDWVQRMSNITARAEEIIREELIYNGEHRPTTETIPWIRTQDVRFNEITEVDSVTDAICVIHHR